MNINFRSLLFCLCVVFLFSSCTRIKEKTRETINKSGETVGESATEFIEGIGKGIENTLALNIKLSKELKNNGISTGKYYVEQSLGGEDNLLTIYMIFENGFSDTLFLKAYSKDELEIGRVTKHIEANKGDAFYVDFEFDKRTKIESKSIILVQKK